MEEPLGIDRFKPEKFKLWTLCMLALNTTQRGVIQIVQESWSKHLSQMKETTSANINTFLQCIHSHKIRTLYGCNAQLPCFHDKCSSVLKTLQDLLVDSKNVNKQHGDKDGDTKEDQKCVIQRKDNNESPLLCESPDKEPSNELECLKSISDFSFDIARLFVCVEVNVWSKNSFEDCSFLELLEMMQNCRLFSFTGSRDVYEKVCDIRKQVVFSRDNIVTDDDARVHFRSMTDVFRYFNDFSCQCRIVVDLQEIENITYGGTEYLHVVRSFLEYKLSAVDESSIFKNDDQLRNDITVWMQYIEQLLKREETEDPEELQIKIQKLKQEKQEIEMRIEER